MVQRFGFDAQWKPNPNWQPDKNWWGFGKAEPDAGVPTGAWCQEGHPRAWRAPELWPYIGEEVAEDTAPVSVKVLTYNLYWWHLFGVQHGDMGSAGKLIANASAEDPFDLMGFQECENPEWVLSDAGLKDKYEFFYIHSRSTCVAFRSSAWTLLERGHEDVAEDGDWIRNLNFGRRAAAWLRLRHTASGRIIFFMNHHGPLPINTGGLCGGSATAFNLLQIIANNAHKDDAVIVVGDFNADPTSMTVQGMATQLTRVYNGTKFSGVDNFLTNVNERDVTHRFNYGGGGSDHDALGLTLELKSKKSKPKDLLVRVF
jgi:endonuclease/exonuclease/phosphatase family metal-dependent hydrolase